MASLHIKPISHVIKDPFSVFFSLFFQKTEEEKIIKTTDLRDFSVFVSVQKTRKKLFQEKKKKKRISKTKIKNKKRRRIS